MQAVIYLRSANKRDETIEVQRHACHDLAVQLGVTIVSEFVDAGVRADAETKLALSAMFVYLAKNPMDLVIASRGRYLAKRDQYLKLITQIGHLGSTVITRDRQIYFFDARDRTVRPD